MVSSVESRQPIPIGSNLIIQHIDHESTSAGGVALPEAAQDEKDALRGKVLAVGVGHLLKDGSRAPLLVQVDDEILYVRGTAIEIANASGVKLLCLHERHVLCAMRD